MTNSRRKEEEWKPCPGYEGLYEVSSLGRFRRIAARVGHSAKLPHVLKTWTSKQNGYVHVRPCDSGGKPHTCRLHRLIAKAFVLKRTSDGECVNHKDGNKENNSADNLEWVTHSENTKHAYSIGSMPNNRGSRNGQAVLSEKQVMEVWSQRGKVSQNKLAERYGVSRGCIKEIHNGNNWKHITGGRDGKQ